MPEVPRDDKRARMIDAIRRHGSASRRELVLLTGLSRSTVSILVGELQARGRVIEEATDGHGGTRGRPATRLRLDSSAGVVLAIAFAHEQVCAGVGDLSGALLADRSTAYDATTADRAPQLAADLAAAAIAAADLEPSAVIGAVVSLPGPVALRDGEIAGSPLLPSWVGPGTAAELRERLGVELRFENDANLAAYAEHCFGAGRRGRRPRLRDRRRGDRRRPGARGARVHRLRGPRRRARPRPDPGRRRRLPVRQSRLPRHGGRRRAAARASPRRCMAPTSRSAACSTWWPTATRRHGGS